MSAFDWRNKPSTIGAELDKRNTASLQCSEQVATLRAAGVDIARVPMVSRKRHGGQYSKAVPSTKGQS